MHCSWTMRDSMHEKTALTRLMTLAAMATVAILLTGCGSNGAARKPPENPDPFEKVNRAIYKFNDVGDRYVARPLAKGYEKATPRALRNGIGNAFDNMRYPITIINDFLQGKFRQGGEDLARFAINSTIGLGGLFDPATEAGLRENDEDFGQTFVKWGAPEGPYLMVPVFGPYTITSGVGDLVGTQASLLVQLPDDSATTAALWIAYLIHVRYTLLGVDEQVREAYDPYIFVRDAYLQNRRYKALDGDVPEDDLYLDEELEDEPIEPSEQRLEGAPTEPDSGE